MDVTTASTTVALTSETFGLIYHVDKNVSKCVIIIFQHSILICSFALWTDKTHRQTYIHRCVLGNKLALYMTGFGSYRNFMQCLLSPILCSGMCANGCHNSINNSGINKWNFWAHIPCRQECVKMCHYHFNPFNLVLTLLLPIPSRLYILPYWSNPPFLPCDCM